MDLVRLLEVHCGVHRRDVQPLDVGHNVERDSVIVHRGEPGFDIVEYRLSGGISSAGDRHGGSDREGHDAGHDALAEPPGLHGATPGWSSGARNLLYASIRSVARTPMAISANQT